MQTFKKLFAAIDMTVGRPWEKIVLFTIPLLLGNIVQQLYNTVDSVWEDRSAFISPCCFPG